MRWLIPPQHQMLELRTIEADCLSQARQLPEGKPTEQAKAGPDFAYLSQAILEQGLLSGVKWFALFADGHYSLTKLADKFQ